MSDKPKLMPCPFCGSSDFLEIREYAAGALGGFVECNECGARGNIVQLPDGLSTIERNELVAKDWDDDAMWVVGHQAITERLVQESRAKLKALDLVKRLVWHAEHPSVRHDEQRTARGPWRTSFTTTTSWTRAAPSSLVRPTAKRKLPTPSCK